MVLYQNEMEVFEGLPASKQMIILLSGGYGDLKGTYKDMLNSNGNDSIPPLEEIIREAYWMLKRDFGHGKGLKDSKQILDLVKVYKMIGRREDARKVRDFYLEREIEGLEEKYAELAKRERREGLEAYKREIRERFDLKKDLKRYRERLRKMEVDFLMPENGSKRQSEEFYNVEVSEISNSIYDIEERLKTTPNSKEIERKYMEERFKREKELRKELQSKAESLEYKYDLFLEELGIKKETGRDLRRKERKVLKRKALDFLEEREAGKSMEIFERLGKRKEAERLGKYLEGANWKGREASEKYLERRQEIRQRRKTAIITSVCGLGSAVGGSFLTEPWPDVGRAIVIGLSGGFGAYLLSNIDT